MASAIHKPAYPESSLQPGVVSVFLKLTGAGAAAPTFASSADNNNSLISSINNSAVGTNAITLSQAGRVLLGCIPTFTSASVDYNLWSVSLSGAVLTIKTKTGNSGAAVDLASNDILMLELRFKNSGA